MQMLIKIKTTNKRKCIFTKKDFNQVFNDKITVPNLRVLKCASKAFGKPKNNSGLFIT